MNRDETTKAEVPRDTTNRIHQKPNFNKWLGSSSQG